MFLIIYMDGMTGGEKETVIFNYSYYYIYASYSKKNGVMV